MTVPVLTRPPEGPVPLSASERDELRQPVARFLERLGGGVPAVIAGQQVGPAWRSLAQEIDLLGIHVPVELGGQGLTVAHTAVVSEELGRLLLPLPYFASACLATGLLLHADAGEQRSDLLSRLVTGRATAAVAFDDQPGAAGLVVERSGDESRLTGSVPFVPHGGSADVLLVVAQTADAGPPDVLVVDGAAAGLRRSELETLDPSRPQVRVDFAGTPARQLPDSTGAGVRHARLEATVLLAAEAVGGAAECVRTAAGYAQSRRQFGQPIGAFQAVQHRLADLHGEVEAARAVVEWAVTLASGSDVDLDQMSLAAAIAGSRAGEAYATVARESIHLHGGIGFTWEHSAHRYFKRALSDRQLLGGSGGHRRDVAAALFA